MTAKPTTFPSIIGRFGTKIQKMVQGAAATANRKKFAYVFYTSNSYYFCPALINVYRLVHDVKIDLKETDIVILTTDDWKIGLDMCTRKCFGANLKIIRVPPAPKGLGVNSKYEQCYVRFEALKLYQYKRVIILDSDGLVLKNMDHLFHLDLEGNSIAASLAYWLPQRPWLTSILLVLEPSKSISDLVHTYLNKENLTYVAKYASGNTYDMDILNFLFLRENRTKILPRYYALLDDYFKDPSHAPELDLTYYVHYSFRKPFYYVASKDWSTDPEKSPSNSSAFLFLFDTFWTLQSKVCSKQNWTISG